MAQLVECVPNFSEGRRREVVDQIIEVIAGTPGVVFLDSEMDPDHHRSVVTFAGEPEPVVEAAFRAVQKASTLIDLTAHQGEHPRMGATDVLPFVPVEGVTLEDCAELARRAGRRIGEELGIPVFLYEAAATRPDRVSLADVRRGEFEGLRDRIGKDADRTPDFGPNRIHPTAGATAVGARRFLVAFNANLNTGDVRVAKAIASTIREQSGGLKHVRALGFSIEGGRRAQVSMNLVNTEATPIHRVMALVRAEAARHGVQAEHALQLESFRRDQVLELRLRRPPVSEAVTLGGLMDEVASPAPTPGGGTVSAVAGALAASLAAMVAGLTLGKKKYAAAEPEMKQVRARAESLRRTLLALGRRDSEAFDAVLKARKLPQTTPAETEARSKAVAAVELEASRVPLRTAEACLEVLELAACVAKSGNPNAITDAGVAGLLARAGAEGAMLNVQINLKSIAPGADTHDVETALQRLQAALGPAARRCQEAVQTIISA